MSPRQTSHRGSALFICSRRSASLSGAAHRDDCGPVPQSPLHLCPQPVFRCDTKIRLRLCRNIHTRDIPLPSDVLITKPHDSAGAHRRACARIADSVCVINRDLLRKFINGKETAKIADIPAQFTPAHACTCCICPYGYPWWGCRTHPPPQDRYTRIHLPGNPTYRCSPA